MEHFKHKQKYRALGNELPTPCQPVSAIFNPWPSMFFMLTLQLLDCFETNPGYHILFNSLHSVGASIF